MVDGVEKKGKKKIAANKKLFFAIAILFSLILGLICGIVVVNIINRNSQMSAEKIEDIVLEGGATMRQIEQYIANTDEKIKNAKTDEEKAELYSERSSKLYNYIESTKNDIVKDRVFSDAYMAEKLNPTIDTAANIYYYENTYGNKEQAERYLQEAKDRGLDNIKGDG